MESLLVKDIAEFMGSSLVGKMDGDNRESDAISTDLYIGDVLVQAQIHGFANQ